MRELKKRRQIRIELLTFPSNSLPEAVKPVGLISMEKIKSLLPGNWLEEIALFKKGANPDPVIALKVAGKWYSLFEWE